MQKSFEEIVDQRGWEAVRDSHRRGLGDVSSGEEMKQRRKVGCVQVDRLLVHATQRVSQRFTAFPYGKPKTSCEPHEGHSTKISFLNACKNLSWFLQRLPKASR